MTKFSATLRENGQKKARDRFEGTFESNTTPLINGTQDLTIVVRVKSTNQFEVGSSAQQHSLRPNLR